MGSLNSPEDTSANWEIFWIKIWLESYLRGGVNKEGEEEKNESGLFWKEEGVDWAWL
jgi:hypothetical protein